ncbi:MAG: hypothetical protein R6U41_01335 [Desulfosalsimonas sp.]|uniref:hypothetical protein n=1 Tax=Desulfosalsimonas sp. TaxID=3073848 RepID=UPI0039706106
MSIYSAVNLPPVPAVTNFPESFIYIDWHWSKLTRILHQEVNPIYYCPIQYHRGPFYYRHLTDSRKYRTVDHSRETDRRHKWIIPTIRE